MPILIIETKYCTVEIRIQGGINAANGFQSSFKVYPVQMISRMPKLKRENGQPGQQQSRSSKPVTFDTVLEKAVAKEQPVDCYTVTYNKNSQLQTYYYSQSREYTFWPSKRTFAHANVLFDETLPCKNGMTELLPNWFNCTNNPFKTSWNSSPEVVS